MEGFGLGGFDPNNPEHLFQMARRGMMTRRLAPQRFDEYYRCYPLIMAPGAERPELNYGSKIILPPSALDKVSRLHVQWPLTMELTNGDTDKYTHAGVLEFVAEEGRAYIPQWMMETLLLEVGDMIQIKSAALSPAKLVKLQPQSVSFLEITDPRAVLEKAFRNFATLTKGDIFCFEYNNEVYHMAVLDVKPETAKMGVSMIETDVSVDFAPSVGYVEPERPKKGSGTSTPRSTRGGVPAGGLLHNQGTMAQDINYSSIAPSATSVPLTNFTGIGQRLVKKEGEPQTSNSAEAKKVDKENPATPAATALPRRTNDPMPLRLPPNKLFFGYEIKPLKTVEDKEREAEAQKSHFAGQGQSLRGQAKRKDNR